MGVEAIELYRKMPYNFRNEVSDICVLNACSHSGLLDEAYSIFNEISNKTEKIITTMVCSFAKFV
jgi:pentatricopeptide repeat protein